MDLQVIKEPSQPLTRAAMNNEEHTETAVLIRNFLIRCLHHFYISQ